MSTAASADGLRVLIFAPIGRDGALTVDLLERAHVPCHLCKTVREVCEGIQAGAGAVLMTEEALSDPALGELADCLGDQPTWSDISVLLFAGDPRGEASLRSLKKLEVLRNVTLLERPVRIAAVISTVEAALRSRRRQYELRDVLVALHSARADAERANRLKDEFLATLSHELRTPLNAILGWVSMLRQSQVDEERVPQVLEVVERNARVQAQLIADVLDVSRMITGQIRLELRNESLAKILADAADSVRPAADAKGVRLVLEDIDPLVIVSADSQRMQQVFWNLLSNAMKFTRSGGEVRITMRRVERDVEVAVTDTGIGLTPEFLPFVFDRFRQADQTFTRSYGGLGLGLAIVKHLVEMHGGEIAASSPGVGAGATFRVRLHAAAGPAVAAKHGDLELESDSVTADGSRLVLVVDDDSSTRNLLVTAFERCHARVVAADSARAAVTALDREVPSVVVADIGMPEEDGLALMRRIRERPANRGGAVPSIALSAYARAEDRRAALAAGFNDFLSKPATPAQVVRAVERWMA